MFDRHEKRKRIKGNWEDWETLFYAICLNRLQGEPRGSAGGAGALDVGMRSVRKFRGGW